MGRMDSAPGPSLDRQREIDARLVAIRIRLKKLNERHKYTVTNWAASASERLDGAQRHAAQAQAAATSALTSTVHAFRAAARAHERVASVHQRMAASGIGDVIEQERLAALHQAAAQADWRRAERSESLLSELDWAGTAVVSGEPAGGVAS
jgi:hypothetical protein